MSRPDGRANDELRPITFVVDFVESATGSVLMAFIAALAAIGLFLVTQRRGAVRAADVA